MLSYCITGPNERTAWEILNEVNILHPELLCAGLFRFLPGVHKKDLEPVGPADTIKVRWIALVLPTGDLVCLIFFQASHGEGSSSIKGYAIDRNIGRKSRDPFRLS